MTIISWIKNNFAAKQHANLRAIPGGNFTVTEGRLDEFLESFCKGRRKWTQDTRDTTFVWVPPHVDSLPLCVDIDLRYETKRDQPLELFEKYADACGIGNWAIVAKKHMYEKKPGVWAGGCHVYFEKPFQKNELQKEYDRQLEIVKGVFDQDPTECLDDSVFLRKNGLIMPGCFKHKGKEAGRYCIVSYRLNEDCFRVTEKEFLAKENYCFTMDLLRPYFSLEREACEVDLKQIPEVKSEHFNLNEFLRVTEGWIPNNSDWKQILFFLAHMKLDERKTAEALNIAWNPTDPNENLRILRKASRNNCTVTKASIIRMLKLHAKGWKREDIFGKPRYYLHDHARAMAEASQRGEVFTEEGIQEWIFI